MKVLNLILIIMFVLSQTVLCTVVSDMPDNTWRKLTTLPGSGGSYYPPFGHPKAESSLTFDEKNGLVIWFGGCSNGYSNNMWVYSVIDNLWTEHFPSGPIGQCHYSITYDSHAQVAVKFVGISNGGPDRYMWSYDAGARRWTSLRNMGGGSTSIQGLAYDRYHKKTIVFGAIDGWSSLGDRTCSWDMSTKTWKEMSPANHPSRRGWIAMDYHQEGRKVVFFGGGTNSGAPYGDTWTYDYAANTWEELQTNGSPSARRAANMVYDPNNNVMILFGGDSRSYSDRGGILTDTWIFQLETKTWTEMHPSNPPSNSKVFAPAFDPDNNVMIIMEKTPNSRSETWAYRYKNPGSATAKRILTPKNGDVISIFPIPFRTNATIFLNREFASPVRLSVHDIQGRMVKDLSCQISQNRIIWNAEDMAAGIYAVRLNTGKKIYSKKISLLR